MTLVSGRSNQSFDTTQHHDTTRTGPTRSQLSISYDISIIERDIKAIDSGKVGAFCIVVGMIALSALAALTIGISSGSLAAFVPLAFVFGSIATIALLVGTCLHFSLKTEQRRLDQLRLEQSRAIAA